MNKVKNTVRIHAEGIFCGYRRAKNKQNNNQVLVRIDGVNSKDEAAFYMGKVVRFECVNVAKDGIETNKRKEGKVIGTHGNNGVVRVKFQKNLHGQAIGSAVKVLLWPSKI